MSGPSHAQRSKPMAGLSLVELLVALAVGSLLIVGAVRAFSAAQRSYRTAQAVARLEETARFALAIVAEDVAMAGFWGLTSDAARLQIGGGDATINVGGDCGTNWALELDKPIDAHNDSFVLQCRPYAGSAMPESDTLVVRRVAPEPATGSDRLLVHSTLSGSGTVALDTDFVRSRADVESHDLVVHAYYVSKSAAMTRDGLPWPALRMKTLVGGSLGPRIVDQEVMPGVENLQIRLGIDRDRPGSAGYGLVDGYVDPDELTEPSVGPAARILAVRAWVMAVAERRENGHIDATTYAYADRSSLPPADHRRRLLLATTIPLRNAAPP